MSQELIRVAILWHEMWHESLEEASRQYFGNKNIEGMLAILEPLHQMMQKVCDNHAKSTVNFITGVCREEIRCERFLFSNRTGAIFKRRMSGLRSF